MTQHYGKNSNQYNITTTRGQGIVHLSTNVWVKDTAGAATIRNMDIVGNCTLENWLLTNTENGEDIRLSCTGGSIRIPTDKTYSLSIGTKQMPFHLRAALLGHNITEYFSGTTEKVVVHEKMTLTSTGVGFNTLTLPGGILSGNLNKIISVYRKSDSTYLYEVGSAPAAGQFTVSLSGTTPVLTIGGTLTVADDYNLVVEYKRVMTAGDLVSKEDGTKFSSSCSFSLSWLVRIDDGPDAGKKSNLIAIIKNAQRTGDIPLGGAVNEIMSTTMEFTVAFREDGDIEFHQAELT